MAAVIIICVWIVHVYAAIWVRGTISAMTRGQVTGGWAWRHHRKWLRELVVGKTKLNDGRRPPTGAPSPVCHVARAVREVHMSKAGAPRHDPIPIGEIATPPFARLPDPLTLFAARAQRFRALADGHQLEPYLRFLAGLSECQHASRRTCRSPSCRPMTRVARAREHGMPPLDRTRFTPDAALDATLDRLLGRWPPTIDMPDEPRARARRALRGADAAARDGMVRAVLADAIPVETLAEHVFVAAALQVHFARLAARLDAGGTGAGRRRRLPGLRRRAGGVR